MSYDITEEELTRTAVRSGDDWIINGVLHHTMVVHRHEDGCPATTFLKPCGPQWCLNC